MVLSLQAEVSSNSLSGVVHLLFTAFDGLKLWDLKNKTEIRRPSQTRNPRDPITCVAWLACKDDGKEMLCCGTGLGYLLVWKQNSTATTSEFEEIVARQIGSGHEVMAMSCCTMNQQLITGTRDR